MKFASFKSRLLAAIPSYIIFMIFYYVFSGFLINNLEIGRGDMQMASFVIMIMVIIPLDFIINLITYPKGYGEDLLAYIFIFLTMLILETLYFTVIDISSLNNTKEIHLRDIYGNKPTKMKILIRNLLKTISRVLLGLPFITMLYSEKKQAIYDKLTGIVIISND